MSQNINDSKLMGYREGSFHLYRCQPRSVQIVLQELAAHQFTEFVYLEVYVIAC